MGFSQKLAVGQQGESLIAHWLRKRGSAVLPVYEKQIDTGKGPQLFLPDDISLIAPDMLVFDIGKGTTTWIDAKCKTVFSWYRIGSRWTTGIDLRHYEDYQRVAALTPWPVWLLFLHTQSYSPERDELCPTGLFGHNLAYLTSHESHRSDKWANGMVYWADSTLRYLAPLEDVIPVQHDIALQDIPF